jgi:hypothetical protein
MERLSMSLELQQKSSHSVLCGRVRRTKCVTRASRFAHAFGLRVSVWSVSPNQVAAGPALHLTSDSCSLTKRTCLRVRVVSSRTAPCGSGCLVPNVQIYVYIRISSCSTALPTHM